MRICHAILHINSITCQFTFNDVAEDAEYLVNRTVVELINVA